MVKDALKRMLDELEVLSVRLWEIDGRHGSGDDTNQISDSCMAIAAKATALARDAMFLSARLQEAKTVKRRVN